MATIVEPPARRISGVVGWVPDNAAAAKARHWVWYPAM